MAISNNTSIEQELSQKKQAYEEALDLCDFHMTIRKLGALLCEAYENHGFEGVNDRRYNYAIANAIRLLGTYVPNKFDDEILGRAESELEEVKNRMKQKGLESVV